MSPIKAVFSLGKRTPWIELQLNFALWLFVTLILAKFLLLSAALIVIVVGSQVFVGIQFLNRFRSAQEFSAITRLGLGCVLGLIISTVVYIVSVSVTNTVVAILCQIILLGAVFLTWKFGPASNVPTPTDSELSAVKWIAIAALLGLSPDLFWTLPVAVLFSVLFLINGCFKTAVTCRRIVILLAWLVASLMVWREIISTRPQRPWFPDMRFAEVWSYSLGKWGTESNPMMIGEKFSYHWFGFAWMGTISNLTNTRIAVISELFAPILISLICATLIYAIFRVFADSSRVALILLAIVLLMDTDGMFRGLGFHAFQVSIFSQFFSLIFALGILLIVFSANCKQLCSLWLVVAVILAAAIGSKISTGLVVAAGLMGVSVAHFGNRGMRKDILGFVVAGVALPSIIAFYYFIGTNTSSSTSGIQRPSWPLTVSFDLYHVYNGPFLNFSLIVVMLTIALGGLGFFALFAIVVSTRTNSTKFQAATFIVFAYVAAFVQMCIPQLDNNGIVVAENANSLYAFQLISALSLVLGVGICTCEVLANSRNRVFFGAGVFAFICGLGLFIFINTIHFEYKANFRVLFFQSFLAALPFVGSLVVNFFLLLVNGSKKLVSRRSLLAATVLISLTTVGFSYYLTNYWSRSSRQQEEWRNSDANAEFGADYLAAVAWLKENSSETKIVATHVNSSAAHLAELSDMKDLAGFPFTVLLAGLPSHGDEINRQALESFAELGNCSSAYTLSESGVTYFLVDLVTLPTPDTERCAEVVFRNTSTIVYQFK